MSLNNDNITFSDEKVAYDDLDPKLRSYLDSPYASLNYPDERYREEYIHAEDEIYRSLIAGAKIKNPETKEVALSIRFELETAQEYVLTIQEEKKLGEIFDTLPYGLVKKNRTGMGATTLELESPRNSIIVVPTKALAYGKYQIKPDKYFYVGSSIGNAKDTSKKDISNYLKNDKIEYKKFLVVADSLYKVIEAIGKSVYNNYFIMLDEIDAYQSDNSFRPVLENTLDYFFQFYWERRCIISATVRRFTNPEINELPIVNIEYPTFQTRTISLVHTNNPHLIAKEKIEDLFENTKEKIVVAYNKISYIRQIIALLKPEIQNECAIFCSPASKDQAEQYYSELVDTKLTQRITFLTCTFFAGIDINDRFHLVSISNTRFIYTLLSPEKLTQIAGRCRDKEGVFSETIIYTTSENNLSAYSRYKEYLLKYANDLKKYAQGVNELIQKHTKLISENFIEVKEDIIRRSKKSYWGGIPVSLIRTDLNKNSVISYFNIDHILECHDLKINLYSRPEQLRDRLAGDNHKINFQSTERKHTKNQINTKKKTEQTLEQVEKNSIDTVVEKLTQLKNQGKLNQQKIGKLIRDTTHRSQARFLERFQKLYSYVPFDDLIAILPQHTHKKAYSNFCNAVIFWALEDRHPFKLTLKHRFEPGNYSDDEIMAGLNECVERLELPPYKTIRKAKVFLACCVRNTQDRHKGFTITQGNSRYLYGMTEEPQQRIPSALHNLKLKQLFEI